MASTRPATPHDAPSIAQVHVSSWQTAYRGILADSYLDGLSVDDLTERWQVILNKPEQFTFVAEADGQVVGFANGGPERDKRGDFNGEIYAIYILDRYRGRGIGRKLFQKAAAALLDQGMDSMLVWVMADNPYRRFYRRLDGTPVDSKVIEIDDQQHLVVAYGWEDLGAFIESKSRGS